MLERRWMKRLFDYSIILIVSIAARLPHILSDHFVVDGDEAIVGVMTESLLKGDFLGLFFVGQNYGFVLPEIIPAALFSLVFGLNDFSLKLPQLLWFALGAMFLLQTIKPFIGNRFAWMVIILLAISPTWFLWAMRARGGYVFAFAMINTLIFLVLHSSYRPIPLSFLIGLLLGLVFIAQPLWFLPALLFVAYYFFTRKPPTKNILIMFLGVAIPLIAFVLNYTDSPSHHPRLFSFTTGTFTRNFDLFYSFLSRGFNGIYLNGKAFTGSEAVNFFVVMMIAALVLVVIKGVMLLAKKTANTLDVVVMIAILYIPVAAFFFNVLAPRYLLPLPGFLIVAVAVFYRKDLDSISFRKRFAGVFTLAVILSASALFNSSSFVYEDFTRSEMKGLIAELKSTNKTLVFTDKGMLQWQVMFYSDGIILARSKKALDRIPHLSQKVNDRFKQNPETAVFVGFKNNVDGTQKSAWENHAFWMTDAVNVAGLLNRGFHFD